MVGAALKAGTRRFLVERGGWPGGAFAPGSLASREKQALLLKGVRAAISKETLVSIATLVHQTGEQTPPCTFQCRERLSWKSLEGPQGKGSTHS